jgi:type I restriction enzyme S subunit
MEVRHGYKQTEVGILPEDWSVQSLGELGSFKNGINKAAQDFGHGSPFINLMDVFGIPKAAATTENLGLVNSTPAEQQTYELRGGDVLFVRSSVKPEGVGLTTLIPNDFPKTVFSGFLIRFRDRGHLAREFKEQCFLSDGFRRRLIASSTVSANTNINQDALKLLQIGFPRSHEEQRAIAAALSDVDALLHGLDRLIAKKRDLKQAAMQQLLTGQTRLPGFHVEWGVKRLGEVVDTDPENLGSETRLDFAFNYIALEDVDRGALRNYSEQRLATAPSRARRKLRMNDVLVSTVRPSLQSHLLFRAEGSNWVCSTGFCVVRCRMGVTHPGYVFFHLFANRVSLQIEALLTGSNYPAINSGDVRALEIPLPDFVEQAAIAAVLSDMDAELAALEARRDKTRDIRQAMMQELLTGKTRLVASGGAHV